MQGHCVGYLQYEPRSRGKGMALSARGVALRCASRLTGVNRRIICAGDSRTLLAALPVATAAGSGCGGPVLDRSNNGNSSGDRKRLSWAVL